MRQALFDMADATKRAAAMMNQTTARRLSLSGRPRIH
jgi:hypothetical protein